MMVESVSSKILSHLTSNDRSLIVNYIRTGKKNPKKGRLLALQVVSRIIYKIKKVNDFDNLQA